MRKLAENKSLDSTVIEEDRGSSGRNQSRGPKAASVLLHSQRRTGSRQNGVRSGGPPGSKKANSLTRVYLSEDNRGQLNVNEISLDFPCVKNLTKPTTTLPSSRRRMRPDCRETKGLRRDKSSPRGNRYEGNRHAGARQTDLPTPHRERGQSLCFWFSFSSWFYGP